MSKNYAIYIGQGSQNPKMSAHHYSQSCQLYQAFSQISRIIARKNNMSTNQALAQYLNQCNKGEHVVLKSYSSFSKSIINRQCFLYNFCKIFETQTNIRNGLDYYQLFRLLCSDFPKEIVMNAVRIVEGWHDKMLEVLINSEKFLNALYISFIYGEYLQQLLQKAFNHNHQNEVPLFQIFDYLKTEHSKNHRTIQKPPIQILYQILLNHLSNKNTIKIRGISFLTQQSIEDFIMNCVGQNKNQSALSYDSLLELLLQNKMHQKLVEKNIFCFDNSTNWANEAAKLLNLKQNDNQHPLNSKKMKKK